MGRDLREEKLLMHGFIIDKDAVENGMVALDEQESRHAVSVMRIRPDDEMLLTDGLGARYLARAVSCDQKRVLASIVRELPGNESPVRLCVMIGSLKADKFELITQKLTEIGVCEIIPVAMERCVATEKRMDRLEKIAREAVKQSERCVIPLLRPQMSWKDALDVISSSELALMPWERSGASRMKDVYSEKPDAKTIAILIGPEGGIAPSEAESAINAGAVAVSLGPRILRAETAAIVSAALAQSLWGDL